MKALPSPHFEFNRRNAVSAAAGAAITLSLAHHWLDFWSLSWQKQGVVLLAAFPAFTWLISILMNRIWPELIAIRNRRWLSFLFPAIAITIILTRLSYSPPVIWHSVEIIAADGFAPAGIQLVEIKVPPGKVVDFSKLKGLDGWELQNDKLVNSTSTPGVIQHSFLGPVGEPVDFIFQASPQGGKAVIAVDGGKTELDLTGSAGGQTNARLETAYKQGFPGEFILLLILLSDFMAYSFLIVLAWLIQEIPQGKTASSKEARDGFRPHRTGLLVLLTLPLALHILSFLTVPLLLASDGMSYLQGAIHWLEFRNFEGVSSARGPGTTFLFVPALLIFGNNPQGVKLVLHLLAMACVPAAYRLGWQLGGTRWFAFSSGLIAALIPDLYIYSNFVMSDVPNMFFGLIFCSLLLSALESPTPIRLAAVLITGSFLALLRPENVVLLIIGTGFLLLKDVGIPQKRLETNRPLSRRYLQLFDNLRKLAPALMLAALPLIIWSARNYRLHGFFGLSNYADEVLYDGWIYYGEASKIPITDRGSKAVQAIAEAYPSFDSTDRTNGVPTGWEIYPALIRQGYSDEEAIALLGQAARDSIRKNLDLALKLLAIKIEDSLVPEMHALHAQTFPTPDEQVTRQPQPYFLEEKSYFPELVYLQRGIYHLFQSWYRFFYATFVWTGLGLMFLGLYRKPLMVWVPVVLITASRIFIPIIIGLGNWRYILSGLILLMIFNLAGVASIMKFTNLALRPRYEGK